MECLNSSLFLLQIVLPQVTGKECCGSICWKEYINLQRILHCVHLHVWLRVYICVCECVCTHVHECTCWYTRLWKREDVPGFLLYHWPPYFLKTGSLIEPGIHYVSTRLAQRPTWLQPWPTALGSRTTGMHDHLQLLCVFQGSKFKSLCKHRTYQIISLI